MVLCTTESEGMLCLEKNTEVGCIVMCQHINLVPSPLFVNHVLGARFTKYTHVHHVPHAEYTFTGQQAK